MEWKLTLFAALLVMLLCIAAAYLLRKSKSRIFTPFNLLFAGVFLAAFTAFIPLYGAEFEGEAFRGLNSVLHSCYSAIRLFLADGDFSMINDWLTKDDGRIYTAYKVLASALIVIAPVMTFGMVLSFFKNVAAYRRFIAGWFRDIYVFSQLNEKTLALAKSLKNNDSRRAVAFCSVADDIDETCKEQAREIDAICFRKDITLVNFRLHGKNNKLYFLAMGEDEGENVAKSVKLISLYKNHDNTHLFTLSTGISGELMLSAADKGRMKVRRVDDVRSVINHILYEEGTKLFTSALPQENGKKKITAVVLGMGTYGMGMVRALAWYCQMDGYDVEINAFDKEQSAMDKLAVACPELVSDKYNGVVIPGEGAYKINVYPGVDTGSRAFADKITEIKDATYAIVSLGDDERNIAAAVYLRMLFERNKIKPVIQAVVRDSDKKKALTGIRNYSGQSYDIDFIGDVESIYCEEVLMDSRLEKDALERHLKWGKEEDFWSFEYNYRSSVASAIHLKAREKCGAVGAGKRAHQLSTEERDALEVLEHKRWNVYMRSEGYVFSGSTDKSSRNPLAKTHNDIVDFDRLSPEEKRKDSEVGSR